MLYVCSLLLDSSIVHKHEHAGAFRYSHLIYGIHKIPLLSGLPYLLHSVESLLLLNLWNDIPFPETKLTYFSHQFSPHNQIEKRSISTKAFKRKKKQ